MARRSRGLEQVFARPAQLLAREALLQKVQRVLDDAEQLGDLLEQLGVAGAGRGEVALSLVGRKAAGVREQLVRPVFRRAHFRVSRT